MSPKKQFEHLKIQLEAIQLATNNFSDDNCIGRGGFGKVYKGELIHCKGKTMVALKRLDREFGQGDSEFWKEVMTLSFYAHENIVSLLGYCDDESEKILVYEYVSNKSLDSYLACNDLSWVQRLRICIGVARGLAYLHTPADTQLRIVHRDIKSSNILLDNNWNAKISDFGLSKFAPANNHFSFLMSNPVGTHGYIDPLYRETGLLTKESDIYSFGVVLFEVLCGRLCYGNMNRPPLLEQVRKYYEDDQIHELVYSNIAYEIDISSLTLFVKIAYQCLNSEREERPLITKIVNALETALDIQEKANAKASDLGAGILKVKVLGTRDVRTKKPFEASKHYLVLCLDRYGQRQGTKTTVKYELNAELNEEVTLYVKNLHTQVLSILVNNVVSATKHCHLGMAIMTLRDLTPEVHLGRNLKVTDALRNINGDLYVEVLYKPLAYDHIPTNIEVPMRTPKDGGLLIIIIHGASLYTKKNGHSYVSLLFRGESRKTLSMMNTNKPMWLQEFRFVLEQPPTDEKLRLEVINNSWIGLIPTMRSLGCVDISLAEVVNKKQTNQKYALEPCYLVDGECNFLHVELHWRISIR